MNNDATGWAILFAIIYFLPMIIAIIRNHKNLGPIMIINFLVGWTIVGWIGALAWAVSN